MPEHVFTVMAVGHSVDVQSNTITLFSVLEQVGASGLPARMPPFTVATLWRRTSGEEGVSFAERIRIVDPEGEEIVDTENSFTFERPRQRVLLTLGNLPLKKTGVHRLEVYIRRDGEETWGEAVTRYPIDVVAAGPPSDENLLPQDYADPEATA